MRYSNWFDRTAYHTTGTLKALAACVAFAGVMIALIAIIITAWVVIVAVIAGVVVIGAVWWVFGGKIKIEKDGRPVGYLRWMTYHQHHDKTH